MKYHTNDIERITRTWNGGPKGMNKSSTKKYFEEVKKHLEMR
jgi:hypothetical protein